MISLNKVSKSYSSKKLKIFNVLEDISFDLKKNEIISVVGKTGCGKTTLLNIISGLLKPTSGDVIIDGSLGYVPQNDLLFPWRSILENILLPVEIRKEINKTAVSKAKSLLKQFDLEKFANSYPAEISGGMKQKASLIRTLIHNPDTILFDEPFSAIDFDSRLKIVEDLRKHILLSGKSAIFVTHNIEEAISIGDKIIVLGGKPTRIAFQSKINIPNSDRSPAKIRKNAAFDNLFEKIWVIMSDHNHE